MLGNQGLSQLTKILYEHRRVVLLYGLFGLVTAGIVAAVRKPNYKSEAVLMLGSADGNDFSQLRNIASQFGIAGAAGRAQSMNLDIVASLATSTVVLRPTLSKFFKLDDASRSGTILSELFDEYRTLAEMGDLAVEKYLDKLRTRLDAQIDKKANTLTLSFFAQHPITSKEYLSLIIQDLNDYLFDLNLKRTEAERIALEKRIERRTSQADSAENRLANFLAANRRFEESPTLRFEHDRLSRAVELHQQILLSLTQLREQALNAGVKAAPTLTVLQPPMKAALPLPRRRIQIVLIGLLAGLFVGASIVAMRFGLYLFAPQHADLGSDGSNPMM
jgi:uncharacterized protein involved in exopolysaccharide biosynthesis